MKLHIHIKKIVVLLAVVVSTYTYAAERLYTTNIGVKEGISHGSVKGLCQDDDGLMWITTSGGVNVYDGVDILSVTVDRSMPIHSPLYGSVKRDRHGNMWLQVSNDIVIYDTDKKSNTLLSEICPSSEFILPSVVFALNGDALIYDSFQLLLLEWSGDHYEYRQSSILSSMISNVLSLDQDMTLIATQQGIQLLRGDDISIISDVRATYLFNANGRIYICGSDGIYIFKDHAVLEKLNDISAIKMILIKDTFWIVTSKELYSVDMVNGEMPAIEPTLRIQDLEINNIASDFDNQLWLATNSGIDIINPNRMFFNSIQFDENLSNNNIRAVHEDSEENLWIGSYGTDATLLFVPKGNFDEVIPVDVSLNNSSIYFIQSVGRDIYIASNKVIRVRWNGSYDNPKFEEHTIVERVDNSDFVIMCRTDSQCENLWVGFYDNGVYKYSFADAKLEKIEIPLTSQTTSNTHLRNLVFDAKDNLWIATTNGLYVLESNLIKSGVGKLHEYNYDTSVVGSLSYNYVLSILFDDDSNVWIGTFGGGLFRSKLDDAGLPTIFEKIEGLPNDIINSLEKDRNGDIWISTNRGICHYETASNNISVYNSQSGIWWLKFGELASDVRRNGELVFGYNGGVIVFRDEAVLKDQVSPKIYIKNFYLQNELVEVGDEIGYRVLLDRSVNRSKKIELKYSENQFGFDFRAIHFGNPTLTKCMYMLEGIDSDWILSDLNDGSVRYTNIPSGEYRFKLKGANSDNIWSDVRTIRIIVQKPWWVTHFAMTCYLILVAIIFYIFYKYAANRARQKTILKFAEEEKQRIENLAKMQNTFFTNISHEFRTPLSLIIAPAKELKQDDSINKSSVNLISRIDHNANILLRLINQLLDFSRFNENKLKADPKSDNIVLFLRQSISQFADVATLQKVELRLEAENRELMCRVDYNMLEQILYNLISNALKHTKESGSVRVILERDDLDISIMVSDTGCGIPKDIQACIFDRFVIGNHGGTGIGLNFTKNLVEMNGGTIDFETSPQGTTFFVRFPNAVERVAPHSEVILSNNDQIDVLKEEAASVESPYLLHDYLGNEEDEPEDERQTLLIVEDNISLMDYLKSYFERSYVVVTASNGAIGYSTAQAIVPDIIISDIMMPEMRGDEMCHRLKRNSTTSHIPVVLLTALSTVSDNAHGYNQGADLYCAKPFDIEVLSSAIKSLIENRQRLQSRFKDDIHLDISKVVANRSDEELIRRAIDYIHHNIHDEELSISKVADHVELSYYLLNKKLQSLLGVKGSAFIRNIRLKYAAKMLLQSDSNVSEIIYSVGFTDLKYFRKQFSEMFGVTPSEYKRLNQNK